MIVAEYLVSLFATFNSIAATFTGTAALCVCVDLQAPNTTSERSAALTAIAFNVLRFICPLRSIVFSPGLLAGLRRIILKELRNNLLQVLIILIRVFLEVDLLDGVTAPDELL